MAKNKRGVLSKREGGGTCKASLLVAMRAGGLCLTRQAGGKSSAPRIGPRSLMQQKCGPGACYLEMILAGVGEYMGRKDWLSHRQPEPHRQASQSSVTERIGLSARRWVHSLVHVCLFELVTAVFEVYGGGASL